MNTAAIGYLKDLAGLDIGVNGASEISFVTEDGERIRDVIGYVRTRAKGANTAVSDSRRQELININGRNRGNLRRPFIVVKSGNLFYKATIPGETGQRRSDGRHSVEFRHPTQNNLYPKQDKVVSVDYREPAEGKTEQGEMSIRLGSHGSSGLFLSGA